MLGLRIGIHMDLHVFSKLDLDPDSHYHGKLDLDLDPQIKI
jgi:hypothetical protein